MVQFQFQLHLRLGKKFNSNFFHTFCGALKVMTDEKRGGFSTATVREYWMIFRGPSFLAVVWFGSWPTPLPLSLQQIVSLSQFSWVSPVELTEGRGWGRSQTSDHGKALSSINHSNSLATINVGEVIWCWGAGPYHRYRISYNWEIKLFSWSFPLSFWSTSCST